MQQCSQNAYMALKNATFMQTFAVNLNVTPVNICFCTVFFFVQGILEDGGEDFSTGEDLYNAIGLLLQQSDDSKSDDDIKDICNGLYHVMNG